MSDRIKQIRERVEAPERYSRRQWKEHIRFLLTELATAQAELARLKADALKVTTEATIEHVKNKPR